MSFNANYPEINNINKNFLELVQETHNADNNLLLSASFGSGDVRYFSANESLNLNDDNVKALKENNVPAELHTFDEGGHGFGMRKRGIPVDNWSDILKTWLQDNKLIN